MIILQNVLSFMKKIKEYLFVLFKSEHFKGINLITMEEKPWRIQSVNKRSADIFTVVTLISN